MSLPGANVLDFVVVFVAGLAVGLLITMMLDEVERREAATV